MTFNKTNYEKINASVGREFDQFQGSVLIFASCAMQSGHLITSDEVLPCSTGEAVLAPCASLPCSPRTPSPSLATPATSPVVDIINAQNDYGLKLFLEKCAVILY